MTQCSLLQVRYGRIRPETMEQAMSLVTTTSPNYLLMGSLDGARAQVAEQGREMAEASVQAAGILRRELHKIEGLPVLEHELNDKGGVVALDPGKVTIMTSALGITGPEAADALLQEGIAVELVDEDHVLFLVTYADDHPEFPAVAVRIRSVLEQLRRPGRTLLPIPPMSGIPEMALSPRQAFFSRRQTKSFSKADGCIAGESISFYPPGIPLIMPGERITKQLIAYCRALQEKNLLVSGPRDRSLQTIEVII